MRRREAPPHIIWVLICPDISGYSYASSLNRMARQWISKEVLVPELIRKIVTKVVSTKILEQHFFKDLENHNWLIFLHLQKQHQKLIIIVLVIVVIMIWE